VRRDLPSGTVTFLFTDIEGSTKLLHELGAEAYAAALADHRRVVREAVAAHGGAEVDTQGDAFFIAFGSADEALAAAAEARDGLAASGRIRVRMGLHTGTPHLADEGYVGVDVHRAARIGSCAHGGQVVVSAATQSAVRGFDLRELGEHRLKDFDEPVPLFQLGPGTFPPLKTISNTNLPRPASSFVGRIDDVAAITALVRDGARLVTLTGPGGTGKTRLAIAAAAELVPEFAAGVFWEPLATVRDPDLVLPAIGHTLGASESVAAHIGEREMLLVLDNLEQVIAAAGEIRQLVEACPRLVVLVTSRERLRVSGETEFPVAPLAADAAVELFCARAAAPPTDAVRRLCRALDDMPLAIELAAARGSVLTPEQILDRLARRLDLLKGGRDADPRQQTLRTTIEWSYDLLTEQERILFAHLSVFRGGCLLEDAEAVLDADLDDLQSLVDKSLVRHTNGRFWMLETIAQYAAERLAERPEHDLLHRRHAERYLDLAETAEPHLRYESKEWMARIEPELDNVRAALDHLAATGQTQPVLRFVGAMWWVWMWRGHLDEGRARIEAALAADGTPTKARAVALLAAADICSDQADIPAGLRYGEQAREFFSQQQEESWHSVCAHFIEGLLRLVGRDVAAAEPWLREAIAGYERLGDRHEAREVRRRLAWMHELLGDVELSTKLHEENLADAIADGDRHIEATTTGVLSGRAVDAGRYGDAVTLATAALRLHLELDMRYEATVDLYRFARILVAMGHAADAITLVGTVEELLRGPGRPVVEWVAEELAGVRAKARQLLAEDEMAEAERRGAAMDLETAAEFALTACAEWAD
jgi:predicted ATPase